MLPYTGDYIEHIDDTINDFKYYTFTPRPLMYGGMYEVDDELTALLIRSSRYLILSTSWRTHPRLEYMVFLQGI